MWVLAAAFVLGGCAANGSLFMSAASAPKGNGTLYIYRMPGLVGSAAMADFYVDGKPAISLNVNGYSYCYLTAGVHEVTQKFNLDIFDPKAMLTDRKTLVDFNMADGGTRYIRLSAGVGDASIVWQMNMMPENAPPKDIWERRFQAPAAPSCG
jgi:hypothetical protein